MLQVRADGPQIQMKITKITNIRTCSQCGKPFLPDLESKNFHTGKWDESSYKGDCKHVPEGCVIMFVRESPLKTLKKEAIDMGYIDDSEIDL